MTSYVLLALLSGPTLPGFGLGYSSGIVRWLARQQNPYGGFSSTQVRGCARHGGDGKLTALLRRTPSWPSKRWLNTAPPPTARRAAPR